MFKRILLAFMFVVAFGAASVGMSNKAMAYGCDYGGYGYRAAYYPPVYASYRSYGYGGPVAYPNYYPGSYAPAYPVYYGGGHRHHRHHHHHHDYHGHGGLRVSFGF